MFLIIKVAIEAPDIESAIKRKRILSISRSQEIIDREGRATLLGQSTDILITNNS
jgi:hypothetical protein